MDKYIARTLVTKDGDWIGNGGVHDVRGYRAGYYDYNKHLIHRLVMVAWSDIDISGLVVHHINGDKLDNRIDNLQPMSRSDHNRLHMEGFKHSEENKRKISEANMGNKYCLGLTKKTSF